MNTRTMVILNEEMEGTQMFQFTSDKAFKVGEVFEHERLEGEHIVEFTDPVTVQVRPVNGETE